MSDYGGAPLRGALPLAMAASAAPAQFTNTRPAPFRKCWATRRTRGRRLPDARSGVRKCLRRRRAAGEKSPIVVDVRASNAAAADEETHGRRAARRAARDAAARRDRRSCRSHGDAAAGRFRGGAVSCRPLGAMRR